jgi:hypothetical protein
VLKQGVGREDTVVWLYDSCWHLQSRVALDEKLDHGPYPKS